MLTAFWLLVGLALYVIADLVFLYVVREGTADSWEAGTRISEREGVASLYPSIAASRIRHLLFIFSVATIPIVLGLLPGIIMSPTVMLPLLWDYWWFVVLLAIGNNVLLIPLLFSKTGTEEEEHIYWEFRRIIERLLEKDLKRDEMVRILRILSERDDEVGLEAREMLSAMQRESTTPAG